MKNLTFLSALVILLAMSNVSFALADADPLPDYARQYIAENFFEGTDPQSNLISSSVETLLIPEEMQEYIALNDWERGQLAIFSYDKLHLLVTCPDGTVHNLVFRDGVKRKDQTLDAPRVRILKRLYSVELWNMPPDPVLQTWLDMEEVDSEAQFAATLAILAGQEQLVLDEETIERALTNYNDENTKTKGLARALGALAVSEYSVETSWAAIWLISRMDKMRFAREIRDNSVSDLSVVDAQLFYENVLYAVKARNEFAACSGVSDDDFLGQVLSPRQTGEPLQRWRRHFFNALEPEVSALTAEEHAEAIGLAGSGYSSVFQYEGATTWEDFGMLSALAVLEGRCEDCSNVNNAMLRSVGMPGCQAYTPWWGHTDGNHAWTWIRGVGEAPKDGRNGVKVFVKTWDGNEDVTSDYAPVTTIELETDSTTEDKAQLMVWNHDEWRKLATVEISAGKVVFENVGHQLNQSLCIRITDDPDRVSDLRKDGSYRWLNLAVSTGEPDAVIQVDYDKSTPFGEMSPAEDYELLYCNVDGWLTAPSSRLSTGGFTFAAETDRLYRITGPGIASRPFTVELDADTGEVITLRR